MLDLGHEVLVGFSREGVDADDPLVALRIPQGWRVLHHVVPHGDHGVRTLDRRPVPAGVHLVSITARGDVVVPAPRARLRGATNVVVSVPAVDDHAAAPGSEPVLRAIGTAVDGLPPPCETLSDAVLDAVVPDVIVAGENALGAALTLAGHAAGGTLVR